MTSALLQATKSIQSNPSSILWHEYQLCTSDIIHRRQLSYCDCENITNRNNSRNTVKNSRTS